MGLLRLGLLLTDGLEEPEAGCRAKRYAWRLFNVTQIPKLPKVILLTYYLPALSLDETLRALNVMQNPHKIS
jgi:hypothetical protein